MSEPLKDFTTVVPFWQPRVTPVELENATGEQLQAMKVTVSNTKIGEYTLVLALDPETLQPETFQLERGDALLEEIRSFLDCVRTGSDPQVSAQDGLNAMRVAAQVQEQIQR